MEIEIEEKEMENESSKEESGEYGKYEEWEIKSAARTLEEAEEIKADPEKMKYVKMCMEKKIKSVQKAMAQISSIADLKAIGKKKQESED